MTTPHATAFRPRLRPLEDRTTPATFTVTTAADSGPGSLRDAIAQANAAPDADTVVFAPALAGQTIALGTVGDTSLGPTALFVTTPVTVQGSGQTIARDRSGSAPAEFRLFAVSPTGDLTLAGLTLTGGLARGGAGGRGDVGGGGGGAAGLGGAVYNQGTLRVFGCALTGNTAVGGANTGGGAGGGGGLAGPGDANGAGGPPNGGSPNGRPGGFGGGGGGFRASDDSRSGGEGGFGGGGGVGAFGSPGGPGLIDVGGVILPGPPFPPWPGGPGGRGGFGGGGGAGGFGSDAGSGVGGPGGFGGGTGQSGGLGGAGAGMGGAIFNQGGTVVVANSSLAGNSAVGGAGDGDAAGGGFGGAVFNLDGGLTLVNDTFANNVAIDGANSNRSAGGGDVYNLSIILPGGIAADDRATVTIGNSVLGYPFGGVANLANSQRDGAATIDAVGPNLSATPVANTGGSVTGTPFTVAAVTLGPIQDNGGPTQTMALPAGSPAVDAGDPALVTAANFGGGPPFFDQRGPGFPRVVNGAVDLGAFEVQPPTSPHPPPSSPPAPVLAGGPFDGTARVLNPSGGQLVAGDTLTFFPGLGANVRVAVADVNGDGVPDFVGATGPGARDLLAIIDGKTRAVLASFAPFEPTFAGGLFVAAADLDRDGKADLVVTPDQGGGPVVAVYSGARLSAGLTGDAAQVVRFLGIADPAFRGGARPALGDVNGDGTPDLVVGAGFGGGPRIAVFDGRDVAAGSATPGRLLPDFFAFEPGLRNGAFVSAGDANGDGKADLAFGVGPGGAPRVRVYDATGLLTAGSFPSLDAVSANHLDFFAGDPSLRGGVRVALRDVDGDGKADLITGSGEGEPSAVRVYKATSTQSNPSPDQQLDPFGVTLANGVFVG